MSEITINLPESLTIHHIESAHNTLKSEFSAEATSITINAEKLDTIDTSGLQSLLALVKDATKNGKSIKWINPTETLTTSAEKIGLSEKLMLS